MSARVRRLVAMAAAGPTICMTIFSTAAAPAADAAHPGRAGHETGARAAAAACQSEVPIVGDVDGDAYADLVVGLPGRAAATGGVDLRLTSHPGVVLTMAGAGLPPGAAGDRFGQAVALGDLDGDGCDEVVTGAPGAAGAGRVFVAHGAPGGFATSGADTLAGSAAAGDGFGSAVALAANLAGDGFDLWVGSPADDVGGSADAGSVTRYAVTADAGTLTFTDLGTVTEDSAGVPGLAEPGDRFGAVLSASRYGVLVGEPGEDVGGARDAGSATWLMTGPAPGPFDHALAWSQSSPGVAGAAEAGDRFGAAVSVLGDTAVVGVPGEDVGAAGDAGMVNTFVSVARGDVRPDRALSQSSSGIPGVAEPGDRFGSSVVLGRNMTCNDEITVDAAVGAPREDLSPGGRTIVDAGTVTVFIVWSATDTCPARAFAQGAELDGQPERGDLLGASLGLGRRADDLEEDVFSDQAFIGVPGEDAGTIVDSGSVQSTAHGSGAGSTSIIVNRRMLAFVRHSGGQVAHLRFGAVLASPAGD